MMHRQARRGALTVGGVVAVALTLAACTGGDGADDRPATESSSDDAPSGGSSGGETSGPAPVQDVCALLDDADVDRLVPDGSREFAAEESFEEADGTCTIDNNLPTTQNQVVVVRVTRWPTFDDGTMRAALEDRCEDVAAEVTDSGDTATCTGLDGDAGEAHALDGTTIVSVEFQNRYGAGVPDAELSTLRTVATEVLAIV